MQCLTLPSERAELLADAGLDALVEHPFTAEFAQTSSLDFVRRDLVGHRLNHGENEISGIT